MKRIITLTFCLVSSFSLCAQNEEKTVVLDEVTIKSAKIVNKVDGQMIYPTDAQKNASNNGYSILQKLSLPNLRVDDISHTVSAIDNRGGVQLRINGIIVSKQEMLALDPKLISKIDFVDNPGVRYGEDVAYVVNIITRRADSGYTIGTELSSTLTAWTGNEMTYAKWNAGKSEFSVSYDFSGYKLKGSKVTQVADYTMNDGSIYTIERNDLETLSKAHQHNVKLTYNLADTTAYAFQVSLSESLGKTPGDYDIKDIIDGANHYTATSRERNRYNTPVLDLYVFRQLTPRQSVTANAVGTYISTRHKYFYDEGKPYQYDVNGETSSVLSEAIYENRLKPFILSAGLNYRYKYTQNNYMGDASALTEMSQNKVYAFSEIKGALKALRYSVGAGVSYMHYNQNKHNYDYWTFRPKATAVYHIIRGLQLRYTYQMQDRVSVIAMTSDATIQTNSIEYTVGNPDLKPSRDTEHRLELSYNTPRWQTFIEGYYKQCHKPNMALYKRTEDNKFIYTQINQKEIDLLHTMAYASYWLMPEKLQIAAYGGMQRCFNYGYEYTHFYTSWFYVGSITAYLGKFTLYAYTDNGNRWLEGEGRGFSGAQTALQTSYRYKRWQFSLTWVNPFCHKYKASEGELLNRNLHKLTTCYNTDSGNQVVFKVSWRMNRGKSHQATEKTINLRDTDTGIIKQP